MAEVVAVLAESAPVDVEEDLPPTPLPTPPPAEEEEEEEGTTPLVGLE